MPDLTEAKAALVALRAIAKRQGMALASEYECDIPPDADLDAAEAAVLAAFARAYEGEAKYRELSPCGLVYRALLAAAEAASAKVVVAPQGTWTLTAAHFAERDAWNDVRDVARARARQEGKP